MSNLNTHRFFLSSSFLMVFFCFQNLRAQQDFDDVIASNKYIDCDDVSYNALKIVKDLHESKQKQKLYEFLDYWESKCGNNEVINRLKIILDIDGNRFSSNIISKNTIEDLIQYRSKLSYKRDTIVTSFFRTDDLFNSLDDLDKLTQEIAKSSSFGTLDERLILDFFASDRPTFAQIKNAPKSSQLKALYQQTYEETRKMWQFHYAFLGGAIQNYGNISIFGTRPSFGVAVGGKQLRHNIDLVFDVRAGPSEKEFDFVYQGETITDDTWTGIYIGGEYTYDFINTDKFDIGISPGLGYESITALGTDEDTDEDGKYLESFNQNIGLVFKYKYGPRGGYVGLQFRYNLADYNNSGGTRLDGEYFSARLCIGNLFSYNRHDRLKNLE